jgi:cytochrome c5
MARFLQWILIMAIAGLTACSGENDESSVPVEHQTSARQTATRQSGSDYQQDSWRARYFALGRETYEKACASCHDDGKQGSPAKGDRESWTNRSPLWAAVLFEHAKNGYLEMPAKGGHPELTDRAVEAAGEYMLSETFPELLRD